MAEPGGPPCKGDQMITKRTILVAICDYNRCYRTVEDATDSSAEEFLESLLQGDGKWIQLPSGRLVCDFCQFLYRDLIEEEEAK